jgi:hypothetical protein
MQTTEPITATAIETTQDALILVLADRRVRMPWERCSRGGAQTDALMLN